MSKYNRRGFLKLGASSVMGVGIRSAITGLPVSFLMNGKAKASTNAARITVLGNSSFGEPLNVCGPGTYDPDFSDYFTHPNIFDIELDDVITRTVNNILLDVDSLSESANITLGNQTVEMARCFSALSSSMLQHLVWFNYRSGANIHPQHKDVLTCYGQIRGSDGRGSEQLPAALAAELSEILGTTTTVPLVLGGGSFTANGSSLSNYSPTRLKVLAQSAGQAIGGPDNFAVMYESFIDEAYQEVREFGTAQQRRFFDQHANSRQEAANFGSALGQLLEDITDDSLESQMRAAAVVAKLRLAPVVITDMAFGGDNHQDAGLINETNQTLETIASLDAYWRAIEDFGIEDEVLFANLDVFGRETHCDGFGRSHQGDFVSGLILGTNVQGGVVGGWSIDNKARATGINSSNGSSINPDIAPYDTLAAYYKTIMQAAGVTDDRLEIRVPTGIVVSSVTTS